MRVPLIIAGPDIAVGRPDALVELEDVNPTVCDIAGVPSLENIDGRSVLDIVHDPSREHRSAAVTTEVSYRAIRTREWKYIESLNDTSELYDLATDPDETRNVIADHLQVAKDLKQQLIARLIEGEHSSLTKGARVIDVPRACNVCCGRCSEVQGRRPKFRRMKWKSGIML